MPKEGWERAVVQKPLIEYATQIEWDYISRDEATALRKGETGLFFYDLLREKLIQLNLGVIDSTNADEIIKRLENVRPAVQGNCEVLEHIRGARSIYHPGQKRDLNVNLIDFDNLENNKFHVADEWQYTNGAYTNRADVVFLVNGIPVIIGETKAAQEEEGIAIAVDQIRRYHAETPEMLTSHQVFNVTHLLDFYYGPTWNVIRKNLFNWKDEEPGNYERKVKRFFDRQRILKLLKDYIIYFNKDDELIKIVLCQHQIRAVEKLIKRALDKEKRRGLIWHTQGSGKTFTMITAARKILEQPEFEKPTILMLVDRNELETQLFNNLEAYSFGNMKVAESKKDLRDLLKSDYRGLIVSMIHKFDKIPKDINTRPNIFVLVDEAHRTTGGDLGNYLMAALPRAKYFGFTGTPIDKTAYGKGTFKVFGIDDEPKGYLDKYSISESIVDGTTVRLNYTLAPNEMRVPTEMLEKEFLSLAEAQGISDIDELNKILKKAVTLRTFLKSDDRVGKIAGFVAEHCTRNVEPMGYKAFLVAVDREACALYKQALDKHLPGDYSTVVYTSAHNDPPLLKQYHLRKDEEKRLRKTFVKKETKPKILIVTDKLLTGFDAPLLYVMYLDKPMRDHALLQAIARVNRPYEDDEGLKKKCGLVVDFVGIFDKLEKALAFDSEEVASVIQDIDLLKQAFANVIQDKAAEYLLLISGQVNDKTIEAAIEHFADKDERTEFFSVFKELEALYEIISPDKFLRDYIGDYRLLGELYRIVKNAFSTEPMVDKDLLRKTAALVKEHVIAGDIEDTLPVCEIDEKTIEKVKTKYISDTVKVINLVKSISVYIRENRGIEPYLISIAEKAEQIRQEFENRQKSTEEALAALERLINEINEARKVRTEKDFDVNTFTIYWVLKEQGVSDHDELSVALKSVFDAHPNWFDNAEQLRALKANLYRRMIQPVGEPGMFEVVEKLLDIRREISRRTR